MEDLKTYHTLKVYQECKDGRLDTAIIAELIEHNIINNEFDAIINFFRKNNRANGKNLVQILISGEEHIFEVKEVNRYHTIQICTLKRVEEWGNYLPM